MKVSLNSETFRDSLSKILSVVDKKNSRPILTYTLINTYDNGINLSATDLEVSAKVSITANVESEGSFCVNAKNLFDILRELPSDEVILELNESENSLKINCRDIHYSLLIFNSNDFPPLSFQSNENSILIKEEQLLDIINKTSHAISTDETRLHLNGIYLSEFEGKLRSVSTDGHRLSMLDTEIEDLNIEALINGIIIPRKGVLELKKLTESETSSDIRISVDESFMYASVDENYFLSIRLISRDYPKYQKVIPAKSAFSMTVEKPSFYDAIKRVKIMSNEKSNGVRVRFNGDEMIISANHPSLGDAYEKVPIQYDGKDMEIGFNAKYLLDALSVIDEDEVILELDNELKPVVIKSPNRPNYLGIIMPLKL